METADESVAELSGRGSDTVRRYLHRHGRGSDADERAVLNGLRKILQGEDARSALGIGRRTGRPRTANAWRRSVLVATMILSGTEPRAAKLQVALEHDMQYRTIFDDFQDVEPAAMDAGKVLIESHQKIVSAERAEAEYENLKIDTERLKAELQRRLIEVDLEKKRLEESNREAQRLVQKNNAILAELSEWRRRHEGK